MFERIICFILLRTLKLLSFEVTVARLKMRKTVKILEKGSSTQGCKFLHKFILDGVFLFQNWHRTPFSDDGFQPQYQEKHDLNEYFF